MSSIGVGLAPFQDGRRSSLASFQDGRHGSKMAAMAPRWPPRPPAIRCHLGGCVNALDHGKVASRPRAGCGSSMYRGVSTGHVIKDSR